MYSKRIGIIVLCFITMMTAMSGCSLKSWGAGDFLSYMNDKYGMYFTFVEDTYYHSRSEDTIYVECSEYPGEEIFVVRESLNGGKEIAYHDNFVAIKYKQQTKELAEKMASNVLGECRVLYEPYDNGSEPDEFDNSTTFEEFISRNPSKIDIYILLPPEHTADEKDLKKLEELVRPNIWSLSPYTSARDEYQGKDAKVFLDANENPYNAPFNRYPDPLQRDLKKKIAVIKGVNEQSIFFGNGSDEAIDLMFRIFCRPGVDNAVAIEPTYGMYGVCADINDVEYRRVLLDENFQPDADKIMAATDANTKLIFFCSPNNPSGNNIDRKVIDSVLDRFEGIVIVDEAYIDFAGVPSYLEQLQSRPNLIVLQTFSKAWGMAGIRLGMAFAQPEIIGIMNKVKYYLENIQV